ncbi:MAG TPA: pseudouridine-5'-phosphate glycosidase [Aggregatilineales bacterium]|jgi:pseudouridine-5'-phosphate glycosidase|nr:pseudouridine-5'-phosphate glycosidase [Aggregatilineales bacterium]
MLDLTVNPRVAEALANNQPVVALESTLVTHGLPYPKNVETALAMEDAVRRGGALPATIAVLRGKITVGLTPDDLERLAKTGSSIRKCSRRDLPIVIAQREDGGTTVAGTMIIAQRAGITVFATGGIGGVHRGHPMDVSADLIELGRTPVAVVCSGAKSILDLPLTLEVLETQGVPLIGYGTTHLPAFYTRSSGLPVNVRVDTPDRAADIIIASKRLELGHGVLITVPVPEEDALDAVTAEYAIQQATREAEARHIHGKDVTPYLLQRVSEITAGKSLRANISLLENNALVAGMIANAVCRKI